MTFFQAAAFQWVNPKAWVMAVTAMAIYANPQAPFLSVLLVSAAFAAVNCRASRPGPVSASLCAASSPTGAA